MFRNGQVSSHLLFPYILCGLYCVFSVSVQVIHMYDQYNIDQDFENKGCKYNSA